MNWLDWIIVLGPLTLICVLAFRTRRYARGVVDFLAAGRVAGRYVISVGDLTGMLSVITLIAGAEECYQRGFAVSFWNNITAPIGIVLALTGFCTYRWRQTRCLSRGQFIEMRYGSKSFRFITAFISTVSEMITNAIGPAIAANFFIYYLGLPHRIMIFGIGLPCYVIIVALCLTLAVLLIMPGGRISLLVTDSIQGILSYPIFVVIAGFIILKFSWGEDISPVLWDRVEGQSFMNPYDISKFRDFNLFAIIVTITSSIMNRASWIGNDSSNSGKTPHEQKMAGILGAWRNGFAMVMILLVSMIAIVFMNSGVFAGKNRFGITNNDIRRQLSCRVISAVEPDTVKQQELRKIIYSIPEQTHLHGIDKPFSQNDNFNTVYFDTIRQALGDSPDGRHKFQQFRTLFQQMTMPTILRSLFPVGLFGLFCLLMIMLLISTDDSRIFNAAACIMQDMVLPFLKKGSLSPKQHIFCLRTITVLTALFFFVVAVFFQQLDYITMFTTIMCALWLGGAGPIMVFGLYTRFGNLTGAWCAIIFGSGTSLLGLVFQRNWALTIYPWLESAGWVSALDSFLRAVSSPFEPWIHWEMSAVKFPINSYEIFFLSMLLAVGGYIAGSFLTYKPYNLDKLLHRGKFADDSPVPEKIPWTKKTIFGKLIGITPEYTKGDRVIAWSVFVYSFIYKMLITFLAVVACNEFIAWPKAWWDWYFYLTSLIIPSVIGVFTTAWFLWGGIKDLRRLFIDLKNRKEDFEDNGQISFTDK